MTYQWNIVERLPAEKDVADERPERLIDSPEIGADDQAGDDHGDRPLDHVLAVRPFDLAQLRDRLVHEPAAPTRLADVLDRGLWRSGRNGYGARAS
jgi:hypothetical protein